MAEARSGLRRDQLGYRVLNWIGIIEQLTRTRGNRALTEIGLSWHHFILLNHFSHRPAEGKTVTGVANAMQQNQPAVTKTLKGMVEAGLMRVEADPRDGRIRRHFLTDLGVVQHKAAVATLSPIVRESFEGWDEGEMQRMFDLLDRLKIYLDDNR